MKTELAHRTSHECGEATNKGLILLLNEDALYETVPFKTC